MVFIVLVVFTYKSSYIPCGDNGKNLFFISNFTLVINFCILRTCMPYFVLILQGETSCRSIKGSKS